MQILVPFKFFLEYLTQKNKCIFWFNFWIKNKTNSTNILVRISWYFRIFAKINKPIILDINKYVSEQTKKTSTMVCNNSIVGSIYGWQPSKRTETLAPKPSKNPETPKSESYCIPHICHGYQGWYLWRNLSTWQKKIATWKCEEYL